MGHGTHATYLNKFGFYKQVAVDFIRYQKIDIAQFRHQTKTLRLKEDYYQCRWKRFFEFKFQKNNEYLIPIRIKAP